MASAGYINEGTVLSINGEAGADYAWSMEGVADGAGRVSAQVDLGAAPRPGYYAWSCEVQWQATPTQYGTLDIYMATAPSSDATQISGDQGNADAALGDVDALRNMDLVGSVVSENAAASEKCVASGVVFIPTRYVSFVGDNNGGATINATDSAFQFKLTPIYPEGQ